MRFLVYVTSGGIFGVFRAEWRKNPPGVGGDMVNLQTARRMAWVKSFYDAGHSIRAFFEDSAKNDPHLWQL